MPPTAIFPDDSQLQPSQEALLASLSASFKLPRDAWTRGQLQRWAFGRHARALFGEFEACLADGAAAPQLQPGAELRAAHVLADADRAGWAPADHALRFCFALVHGAARARAAPNPLADRPPPRRARDDAADFFRPGRAGPEAELRRLGRGGAPPPHAALMAAALEVLRVWVDEWRATRPGRVTMAVSLPAY